MWWPPLRQLAVLPGMVDRGWGRIVDIFPSAIAAHPGVMVGMNTYAASKAALEAHTVNLAVELTGSGVTVNTFRPGSVDTAMQAGIRGQDPTRIGATLHERFVRSHAEGAMITPEQSAQHLIHISSLMAPERSGKCPARTDDTGSRSAGNRLAVFA